MTSDAYKYESTEAMIPLISIAASFDKPSVACSFSL